MDGKKNSRYDVLGMLRGCRQIFMLAGGAAGLLFTPVHQGVSTSTACHIQGTSHPGHVTAQAKASDPLKTEKNYCGSIVATIRFLSRAIAILATGYAVLLYEFAFVQLVSQCAVFEQRLLDNALPASSHVAVAVAVLPRHPV